MSFFHNLFGQIAYQIDKKDKEKRARSGSAVVLESYDDAFMLPAEAPTDYPDPSLITPQFTRKRANAITVRGRSDSSKSSLGSSEDATLQSSGTMSESLNRTTQMAAVSAGEKILFTAGQLVSSGIGASSSLGAAAKVVQSGASAAAGIGLGLSVIDLVHAMRKVTRAHGRRTACLTLFTFVQIYMEEDEIDTEELGLSNAERKANFAKVQTQAPIVNLILWLMYKYKPALWSEIKNHCRRLIPALIGIGSGIISILAVTGAATLGIAPLAIGIVSGLMGLAMVGRGIIKHQESKEQYKILCEKGIIPKADQAELPKYIGAIHGKYAITRFFGGGITVGDWFRYRIAKMFVETKNLNLGGDLEHRSVSALPIKTTEVESEFDQEFTDFLVNSMWEIIKTDVTERKWKKALEIKNDPRASLEDKTEIMFGLIKTNT